MGKRILPLSKPIFSTWPPENFLHAFILALRGGNRAYKWILNRYVNFFATTTHDGRIDYGMLPAPCAVNVNFKAHAWNTCPFVKEYTVSINYILSQYDSIVDYLRDAIEHRYCVRIKLNQFFNSTKYSANYIHENYFYGYDDKQQIFYIADHFYQGKFSTKTVSFEDVNTAFALGPTKREHEKLPVQDEDYTVKIIRPWGSQYKFDLGFLKRQLKDYLRCTNSDNVLIPIVEYKGWKYRYGLSYYDFLIEHITNIINKTTTPDHRLFTVLLDHKTGMELRIRFLKEQRYIIDDSLLEETATQLKQKATALLFRFLKANMLEKQKRDALYQKMINTLSLLKDEDRKFTQKLLDALNKGNQ